jgi:hypothetical protein
MAMAHRLALSIVVVIGLVGVGCGSPGGGGSVTSPTAPTAPGSAAEPAAVNVGGTQTVAWNGQASYSGGSGTLQLLLTQNGAQVSGTISAFSHMGPFAGTVSGTTLTFNFSEGNKGAGCGNAISGTADVGTSTMTGTFSGHDCKGQPVTGGTFTCALDPPQTTTRLPVTGTWTGPVPAGANLGGGTWTWVIARDPGGDVNAYTVSGTVTVSHNNTLALGSGSFTGTVVDHFPGAPWDLRLTMNATFTGPCPTTIEVPLDLAGPDGVGMAGVVSGTSCSGAVPRTGVGLSKQ